MRDLPFEDEFDAAFNWFGSFGYFSDAEMLAFSQKLLHALRPGGRFLVESMNKSWVLSHFVPESDVTIGGVRVQQQRRFDRRTGRAVATFVLLKGDRTEKRRVSQRLYNGTEMRALLRSAGFGEIKLFGYPPLGSFTRHSRRLIAVARRPKD
jgi:SAM-dependent methyltransferase